MERIMVGVDASPASVDALRRAVEEAVMRDATLEVVHVFTAPEPVAAFPVPPSRGRHDPQELERLRAQASDQLGDWLREIDVDLGAVDVEWTVVADRRPARALVERSREADLVVVGARGRGGFGGLKLGAVSDQVVRHAKAPVMVVRPSTGD